MSRKNIIITAITLFVTAFLVYRYGLIGLLALLANKIVWLKAAVLWPLIKFILLASIKFIALGTGAIINPVWTVNLIYRFHSTGDKNHAKDLHSLGKLDDEELEVYLNARKPIDKTVEDEREHLSREEARTCLFDNFKETVREIPVAYQKLKQVIVGWFSYFASNRV